MPATHLVFDLDDTLYPERDYAVGGFRAAADWAARDLGVSVDVDRMVALLDSGHLGRLFPTVLAEAKPAHTADDLAAFVRAYGRHTPRLTLFPDAVAALDHWQGRCRLGLITDGHAPTQQAKIAALTLEPRFDHIITTGALGPDREFHKPHPRAYEMMQVALGQIGSSKSGDRFVYIGDNIAKDFVSPNALGWISIWIDRPDHRAHRIHKPAEPAAGGAPQHTIHDLADIRKVLG